MNDPIKITLEDIITDHPKLRGQLIQDILLVLAEEIVELKEQLNKKKLEDFI